jgi:hypothetical protein
MSLRASKLRTSLDMVDGYYLLTGVILASICSLGELLFLAVILQATSHSILCTNNHPRSHDSKAKVWRIETRSCVATHSHGDKPLWSAKWLPKNPAKSEMFALAGGNNAISFYREAAG